MKHIPYRQNPTVIDTSKKARPPPGANRPKTQKSILKVEETHHSPDVLKDKVGINMNIEAVQDTKMENDRRSETVFGQSGGGITSISMNCLIILINFSMPFFLFAFFAGGLFYALWFS